MFTAALFTTAKTRKQLKCPSMGEWIKKMWYKHTMEYYSAVKKKEFLPFATTWMNLENRMLSETSQSQNGNTTWYHLYKESKIVKLIVAESRMVVDRSFWGGRNEEVLIKR